MLTYLLTILSFIVVTPSSVKILQNSIKPYSIRSVDFDNFTYPLPPGFIDRSNPRRTFRLKNGERPETPDEMGIFLSSVSYGEVTGDGKEEAIVTMSIVTGGSALPNIVYIYTLKGSKPRLLWAFDTGDRADGGLRRVDAENGYLLVELYGNGKVLGKDLYAEDKTNRGACCPAFFTRARYKWTGNGFRLASKPKVLPNPIQSASSIKN